MRLQVSIFLIALIAFGSGYEVKKRLAEQYTTMPGDDPFYRAYREKGMKKGSAGQTAGKSIDRLLRQRRQEQLIVELEQRVQHAGMALAELGKSLDQAEPKQSQSAVSAGDLALQIQEARNAFSALEQHRLYPSDPSGQRDAAMELQVEELKFDQEKAITQLKERLLREQEIGQNLRQQTQTLLALNADTDALRALEPRLSAQEAKVSQIQAELQAYQLRALRERALAAANIRQQRQQQAATESSAVKSGNQSKLQLQKIQSLEQQLEAVETREAAGQASKSALYDKYQAQKREYNELLTRLESEQKLLEQMKKEPSPFKT